MAQIINHYSALLASAFLVGVIGYVLLRKQVRVVDLIGLGVIVLGLMAAWWALHPRQSMLMDDAAEVQAMIGAGKPVLLQFQSPY